MWSCPGSPADGGSPHKPLEGLLRDAIKALGDKERLGEEEIVEAWKAAAGAAAAGHSKPVSFKGAVVVVNVDNSGWLYELTLKKKEITRTLSEKLGGRKIKEIRFRIGEVA